MKTMLSFLLIVMIIGLYSTNIQIAVNDGIAVSIKPSKKMVTNVELARQKIRTFSVVIEEGSKWFIRYR